MGQGSKLGVLRLDGDGEAVQRRRLESRILVVKMAASRALEDNDCFRVQQT